MEQGQLFATATDVVRKDGSVTKFNAGDAVAAVVDVCTLDGVRIPPRLRARLGRTAREILEEGQYTIEELVTAMIAAVRRARVDLVEQLLLERDLIDKRGYIDGRPLTPEQLLRLGNHGLGNMFANLPLGPAKPHQRLFASVPLR